MLAALGCPVVPQAGSIRCRAEACGLGRSVLIDLGMAQKPRPCLVLSIDRLDRRLAGAFALGMVISAA